MMQIYTSVFGLIALGVAVVFFLSSCRVGHPFKGPGYHSKNGLIHPDAGDLVLVAITQGDITSGSGDQFAEQLSSVMDAIPQSEGLIGYAVRKELVGSRVWTMSVWVDRRSLTRFVASPAHRDAIKKGGIPRESVNAAYVQLPKDQVPLSWEHAERLLKEQNQLESTP